MKRLISLFLFLVLKTFLFSQQEIKLVAKSGDYGVKLRCITSNATAWLKGLENGYIVERATYNKTIKNDDHNFIILKDGIVSSYNQEDWDLYDKSLEASEKKEDEYIYAGIAFSFVSNRTYLSTESDFEKIMKYKEEVQEAYFYSQLCSVQSWKATEVLGLGLMDSEVEIGKEYIYRIRQVSNESLQAYLIVRHDLSSKINQLSVDVSEQDSRIVLSWIKEKDATNYIIETSTDNRNFIRPDKPPTYDMYATLDAITDSLTRSVEGLINYQDYYFKIIKKDIFCEESVVAITEGTPKDLTPPSRPSILVVEENSLGHARIEWSFPQNENSEISGFRIARSVHQDKDYVQIHESIIPPDWRAFDDQYFSSDTSNFYIIEAIDTYGNSILSNFHFFTPIDQTPPAQPINITGIMDSVGVVTLEMEPQEEKDFMGYRIYMANNPKTEFSVIQETYNDSIVVNARNPILIDTSTVESLSSHIYYKVGALDYHYNESESSEIIKVKRPDIYPPVSPLITGYKAYEDRIHFDIALSSSFDVRQNYIYRREASDEEWSILDSLGIGLNTTYVDSTGEARVDYVYSLKAIDAGGLESEFGNQLKLSTYRKENNFNLETSAKYFSNDGKLLLIWEYPKNLPDDITSFEVLVKTDDQVLKERFSNFNKNGIVIDSEISPKKVLILPQSRKQSYEAFATENIQFTHKNIRNDRDYKKIK